MNPSVLRQTVLVAAIALLHGALLWLVQRQLQAGDSSRIEMPRRAPLVVRLLAPAIDVDGAEPTASPSAARSKREPARRAAFTSASAPATAETAAATLPIEATPPPTAATAEPALDAVATRRAIRESALAAGPAAQQAVQAGAALRAPTASQRLSNDVQQAGRGDCAKGEYAGGGMGLLSLPFLAAAAINGDCAK